MLAVGAAIRRERREVAAPSPLDGGYGKLLKTQG
jgi:hypothetical protein